MLFLCVVSLATLTGTSNGTCDWPTVNIPSDPWLGGKTFFDQGLFLDPFANAWGVVTSWSSKWTIGSGNGVSAAMVSAVGANASNPMGILRERVGVSLKLNP
jgi:hypothetical protein